MKLKNQWIKICSIFMLIAPLCSHAQHGSGNSGEAVEINGKFYLLDLVENGIQNTDYKNDLRPEQSKLDLTWAIVEIDSGINVKEETRIYLSHVLKSLSGIEPLAFASAINAFNWRFVDFPLEPQDDTHPDTLASSSQLAVRSGQTIKINKAIWSKMNVFNQVATIMHEVIYASLTPLTRTNGTQFQDAASAMEINATIMDVNRVSTGSRRYQVNGQPKIDFLRLGDVYGIIGYGFMYGQSEYSISHNSHVTVRIPDARDKLGELLEEHMATSLITESEVLHFEPRSWCAAGIAGHYEKIEVNNGKTTSTLGFKDYIDENQVHKKYFGLIESKQVTGLRSEEFPDSIGLGSVLLKGKDVDTCVKGLSALIKKTAQSMVDYTQKTN